MSTARHRGSPARAWFRRLGRLPSSRAARLVSAAALVAGGACAVVVPVLTASPAAADTTTQNFDGPGSYTVVIPNYVTSFSVTGLGGAGLAGQPASDSVSTGGAGGSGSYVAETFSPIPNSIRPGDTLRVVVGAAGGGAAGGSGDGIAGSGGAGGGYTYISDQTTGEILLIAAGGGGGGGGSGLFAEYNGGDGGTDGWGSPGLGQYGQANGAAGSEGPYCPNSIPAMNEGSPGQNAPTASADGGGGGGGGGGCGGYGGQATAGSGGGGGGSGYSVLDPAATSRSLSSGSNTGNGSASVTFNTQPPANKAPVIDSANCFYSANGFTSNGVQTIGELTARAYPPATLSLAGQPSWIRVGNQLTAANSDGTIETQGPIEAPNADQIVNGQYTFPAVATNSVGSIAEPVTVVEAPGVTQPAFLSAAAATATVGQPFSFQASAVGCPPIATYSISQNSTGVPWLTISSNGVLSGTPTAADAGTHTFTLSASPNGVVGTPVTQTFTLTVNPAAATAPGAPAIGTATAGNGQATVAFTPPASDGGSPVTGYTVEATDTTTPGNGGQTAAGTGSPVTITGLTNGDSYTFTVKATNAAGTGPASAPSNAVTPVGPTPTASPTTPTPSPTTPTPSPTTPTASPTPTPTTSPTYPAPTPSVPGRAVITRVTVGNHAARVCFRAPRSNGGSHIYRYTVTATDLTRHSRGGQTAAGHGSPITITGLTNGDRYTFTVAATNTEGTGPASAPSRAVTPAAPRPKRTADLSVALTRHPAARCGSTYTETVTVTNHGPEAAPRVVAKMVLSRQLSVVATHGGKRSGLVISWTDGLLRAGKSVSFTVTVRVNTRAHGTALVAATIIAASKDPKPRNNWALTAVRLN